MDNDKAFCLGCSQEVDANTHMNCTLTFDDLLDLEERDGNENFQPNPIESTVQQQQAINSSELRRDNQNNNPGKRKTDVDPEASIQTPTKIFISKRNSTSPLILEAHNPRVQRLQNTEHGNCTSPYGTENWQTNQMESAVQLQQAHDSCEFARIDQGNNSGEKKPDFDSEAPINPEAFQFPTKILTSKSNSTSPPILEAHNPGIQRPQDTEYGNCTSFPKENYGLHYNPFEASDAKMFPKKNLLTNPAFHQPTQNIHWVEQKAFVNGRQQTSEFQNANLQRHEPNKLRQESPRLIYETNTLQPGNILDLRTAFPNPLLQRGMNALGYMANDLHINHPRLQNRYTSYGPHPRMMNLANNMNVKNSPEILTRLPSLSKHTVDSNYATRDTMTVKKGTDLLGQNKRLSTNLVSKTETQNASRSKCSTSPHINSLMSYIQNTEQESTAKIKLQEYTENVICQKNEVGNTNKRFQQKQVEQNVQQKNSIKSTERKDLVEYATRKDLVESAIQKDLVESAIQKDLVESAIQKDLVESAIQKDLVESAIQKDLVESAIQKDLVESAIQKDLVESAIQKDLVESAIQKDLVESAIQKDLVASVTQKDLKLENSNVFTGKGYESIEDFIKALNDGTLYKRY
ncbi:unnamed protein product [Larinioides sclopetarius]|uniref:Uncharacterized protein n=1 Tax=Larinioides sclopetarius TaxID=280406 RepID=A0AAV2B0B1_9ARAC